MKRLFDIVGALIAILLLSPIFLAVALAVGCVLGSPVLFRQIRPGLNGKPFLMLKFRSMSDDRDIRGGLLSDAERMTALGRFLRASSLDELPELLNVFRGEMSLVGPRPLLLEYMPLYTADQARRHEVRPGITGWAQVNGRNAVNWEERFALDVWYVDHRTIWLDVKILLLTIVTVLRKEGIAAEGDVTMHRFTGSPRKSAE